MSLSSKFFIFYWGYNVLVSHFIYFMFHSQNFIYIYIYIYIYRERERERERERDSVK